MASRKELPGNLHINQNLAPKTANPDIRPLAPGEFLENPNGSWSSEITASVADPGLNGGAATNVPTLWLIKGKPTQVSEDEAAILAAQSGLPFPAHPSMDAANAAAIEREKMWQTMKPQDAIAASPLWGAP